MFCVHYNTHLKVFKLYDKEERNINKPQNSFQCADYNFDQPIKFVRGGNESDQDNDDKIYVGLQNSLQIFKCYDE